jgi:hypothetical protein
MVKRMSRKYACQMCHKDLENKNPIEIFDFVRCHHAICDDCWIRYWRCSGTRVDYNRCLICYYHAPGLPHHIAQQTMMSYWPNN